MRLEEALRQGVCLLQEASVPSPQIAAEVLLMHALGCDRAYLYAHPERELTDSERVHYGACLKERMGGKPTQYITGRQEFWGLELRVTPAVLIPRPETEHVVECALELARSLNRAEPPLIVDVGTGSGCIAIALAHELPRARLIATDVSAAALAVAAENVRRRGARTVWLCRCHLLSPLATGCADIVVSNPPYVPKFLQAGLPREVFDHEPHEALFAGPEGIEVYAALAPEAARALRPGGWLVLELGYNMADRVRSLFLPGWSEVEVRSDLAGIPRVLSARRSDS